jgi:tetratricopeptide (TPR) repeat protein
MASFARPWRGAGSLALAALLLGGAASADDPPLSEQLAGLGRQALAQGEHEQAATFLARAVQLDPNNTEARRLLSDARVVRVARQDTDRQAPAAEAGTTARGDQPSAATLEAQAAAEQARIQQFQSDVRERRDRARALLNQGDAASAINLLRLGVNAIDAASDVPDAVRGQLRRELETQIQQAVRREEQIELERAEAMRLAGAAAQRTRDLAEQERVQETVSVLMQQFDALMAKGVYNVLFSGGQGDIQAATRPFFDARLVAQHARALDGLATAPWAGILKAQFEGFLAQELQFEELKEYRYMLTLQDVDRAAVPFPDTITIEYPPAEHWREISEKRIRRYESVSLDAPDAKTKAIYDTLDQPIAMPFAQETALEDVIKYVQSATRGPELPQGIPIYVDPAGLLEAEKTLQSPVTLNLEGVPLRRSLRLLLRQLDLNYTVKDGLMTITYIASRDQPTEIRVYPVADLAMIPISLISGGGGGGFGGGGMGGMGGGMGGMGMGGMGGGMGGMGGGMGGMGGMGGGMGGFRSVPVAPAQDPGAPDFGSFLQKKRN